MKRNFPWRSFLKSVAAIAVPVALQNLLTTTGSMVDTMMLASLGETTVGAVGLCAQFSSLLFSCYWGFVGGGCLFFSQYWGAKDDEGISRSYGLTLTCMMFMGVLFCLLATTFPEFIMSVYTDKESIQKIGVEYLRIAGFAYPFTVLSVAAGSLLRCTDKVRLPLYASIASVLTNMALNWVLIQGRFGFPAMGVRGAALATVIAGIVNIATLMLLARKQKYPYLFRFRAHFHWCGDKVKEYFIKCFPIICNEFFMGVSTMVINVVLGHQSEQAIAATAVFRTLEGLVVGFFAGFSNAASILVGTEVGAGNLKVAYHRAIRLVYLCSSCIFLVVATLVLVHKPLLSAMSLGGESLQLGFGMLVIYAVASIVRMGNWTQNDTYRSAGDATFGTVLEITFMYVMVLPLVWLSGFVWHAPFLVVFGLCYIDEPVRFVLMQLHMYSGKWIKPVTPEGTAALPAFRAWLKEGRKA